MKVCIFGANGRVGQRIVQALIQKEIDTVAFIHNRNDLTKSDHLQIIRGDIYNATDVAIALNDVNVVICTLSSWGSKQKNVLSSAMAIIIPEMKQRQIHRIISLTGSDATMINDVDSTFRKMTHHALSMFAGAILRDGEDHIRQLSKSTLDWTAIRSPIMNNQGSAEFKLSDKPPLLWQTIHRQAVADSIVGQITDNTYFRQAPYIRRIE